ncbi:MAG: NUDIX hydrolase [Pseudomonadota bacterium]
MPDIAIAILVDGNKVLMGRRAPHKATYANCWDFIGGHVEGGETLIGALIREVCEEVNVRPIAPVFLGKMLDQALGVEGPPTYHFFSVHEWSGGSPVLADHEHSELRWVTVDDMRLLDRLSNLAYMDIATCAIAVHPTS